MIMLKCDENDIIQFIQECLCQQYPLNCTTSHIRTYLKYQAGIHFNSTQMVKFLRRYENVEWYCIGTNGRDLYWRFKDGLLD